MKKTGIMEAVNLLKEKKLLIEANINAAACDETIEYISYNSQDIKPGTLFFCKGVHFKEQYLKEAFDKGNEMLILVTELTVNTASAQFIATFGSPDYKRHNEELMLSERSDDIKAQIA